MSYDGRYPEIYYQITPKANQCIYRYYPPYMPIYNLPDDEQMDMMVDEVYEGVIKEYPEIDRDPKERRGKSKGVFFQGRQFYGRRRLLRDMISIILLSELLKRRNYYPGYGYGYMPWY
ncbi:hypothetical protein [Clostridiisalibacter paucivorans]|uniref:hypothetical protein n=1 Tax=Clostridiisalibacter paucivorans TaxID=408753 RepID=UPI00047D3A01|nr:hypothetical protein [Clostridiisalibacter paucivorans]